jgi:hypothetical protein
MSSQVADLLVGPYPPYNPLHEYTVRLSIGEVAPQQLTFSYNDCGCGDNSGSLQVSLALPCET